jgi:hypothetical protein
VVGVTVAGTIGTIGIIGTTGATSSRSFIFGWPALIFVLLMATVNPG